jgi:hypothetical protein
VGEVIIWRGPGGPGGLGGLGGPGGPGGPPGLESGPHEELLQAEGTYAELFEMQARAYR